MAIIGGGPAGSTVGAFIRKYDPSARVLILEREKFPRDHVGESQLPAIGSILHEIGAWDKVEAAGFPIKVGATYRWGSNPQLWDFEFIPPERFRDEPRPAKYEGQRIATAFQVDRAIYDDILLRHAESLGCEVREETKVAKIHREHDRVRGLELDGGETVTAKYYIDASGAAGVLRRAMDIPVQAPKRLRNMAMWDYWENAEWAVEIGVGGTRVQILSIGSGWIWFIPLGPTRTSIGFICPVEYYKERGVTPAELYREALEQEPRVRALTKNAIARGKVETTKDWSYYAERLAGENWFLVGESAGFADPILASGMTLAHKGAKEVAYTLLDLLRDEPDHDAKWLKSSYEETNRNRVRQYIRFAEFWYAANGQFKDLEKFTAEIAKDAGLSLSPKAAFRWLSQGGFGHEDFFFPGVGGLDLLAIKEVTRLFTVEEGAGWEINKYNTFKLNLVGARKDHVPIFQGGRIVRAECYRRGGHILPLVGAYGAVAKIVKEQSDGHAILDEFDRLTAGQRPGSVPFAPQAISSMESMLLEGWIQGKVNKKRPPLNYDHLAHAPVHNFHPNADRIPGLEHPATAGSTGPVEDTAA